MKIHIKLGLSFLILAAGLSAQTGSQVVGTVQDASGLGVPGAEVRITQTATGLVRTVRTDTAGSYVLPDLPVGEYQLSVTKDGFSTYVQNGVVLQVNSNPQINVKLDLGSTTQTVQVEAAAAMVEAHNAGVGQVIDQQHVVDLPLNGREVQQLILISGLTAPSPVLDLNNNKNYPVFAVFSVSGGTPAGLTYILDGGNYNDPFNNLTLPLPFPDAVQEFKFETSAVPAQYGFHSTGAVTVVTKSGTNQLHGDGFEFVRNYVFNSRQYFATARDSLKRNQFGGTLGGPIRKNKLFFFGGYQATIIKTNPATTISYVPTAAMLAGNFTTIASAQCQPKAITLTAPFVNNQISPTLFSPQALNVLKHVPVSTDPCGKYQYGIVNNSLEQQGLGKVDYLLNEKHTLLARYTYAKYNNPAVYNGDVLTTTKAGLNDRAQSIVLGDTYVLSPDLVNSTRVTVNRTHPTRGPAIFFNATDVGSNVYSAQPGYFELNVSGGGGFATSSQTAVPGYFNTTAFQLADDVNYQHGGHQFGFGVNYIRSSLNSYYNVQTNGIFGFNGTITGLGLSDLLLGDMSSFTQGQTNYDDERSNSFALYAQDSWKVNRHLTINAGIRWEPYLPMEERQNHQAHFENSWFLEGLHSTEFPNAPAGELFGHDPGLPGRSNNFGKMDDFAPRLAMIWDPQGQGRTVVRASYGLFYDFPGLQYNQKFAVGPPWGSAVTINNPVGGFANPWQGYPGGSPFPATGAIFPTQGTYVNVPLHIQPTYIQNWNLAVSKQVKQTWLLTATYLGSHTVHEWGGTEGNPEIYVPGNCPAGIYGLTVAGACSTLTNATYRRLLYRENPVAGNYYGSMVTADGGGTDKYEALLLSVQHRFSRSFSVIANHTWSHCDSDPVVPELSGAGTTFINPQNREMDFGNCTWDLRQASNISFIAESPKFSNKLLQDVLGNWRFSTITTRQSGLWSSLSTGVDSSLLGVTARPNLVLPSAYLPNPNAVTGYLNPKAFASPAAGTYGTLGPESIEGPGLLSIDIAFSRIFKASERHRFEFRAEAFNVTNSVNLILNNLSTNSILFGTSTSSNSPRIGQVAMKYTF